MQQRKKLVFVEGNISSSKTTILNGCKEAGFTVFEEPLDVWKERYCEKSGDNILGNFYADTPRWAFTFEVAVMTTRFMRLIEAIAHPDQVVILERSLWTDRHVFAPLCYSSGNMTEIEWKVYIDWYETFMKHAVEHAIANCDIEFIFIDTSPEICFERKKARDRKEEKTVPIDYLLKLHEKHQMWLLDPDLRHRCQVVDGTRTKPEVLEETLECLAVCLQPQLRLSEEDGAKIWQKITSD